MIKNNKFSSKNIIELEIEREKTKQLELIKQIKKIELRLKTNENYKKKNKKQLDVYNMFNALNNNTNSDNSNSDFNTDSESESDLDLDINIKSMNKYMKNTKNSHNIDSEESDYSDDEIYEGINDDSNIDTISMCSSYSIEKYEEVELIAKNS